MVKGSWYPVYKVSEGAGQPIKWSGNEVTNDITWCHVGPAPAKCDTQYKSPLILSWDKLGITKVTLFYITLMRVLSNAQMGKNPG